MSLEQELGTLRRVYAQHREDGNLNIMMRDALHHYATDKGLKFEQDSAGNIYLTRLSNDHSLASIAIAFPIDTNGSPQWFASAFSTFNLLSRDDVLCGITLMGFTSLRGEGVGLETWENAIDIPGKPAALTRLPLLAQFAKYPSPANFPFSAILQISESAEAPLSLVGSSLLTAKAQKILGDQEASRVCTQEFRRAPRLRVEGPGVVEVSRRIICAYSKYVAALFDNFD
ncbi:hypothetical protein F5B22DRAFT_597096 [Xylaria bambusicola]|uniref:uncharacterized protein n=1 Tax=Xylaria bambusicola TaxID=326684 RepID=UPI00200763D5|nr:uncharacterized protein F5B22DRAFT_597096 [Xylaria bambusicola]KAI0520981.1 hypothetical protein F5B22DRAFT_597096 [Xylaria bambusicola]